MARIANEAASAAQSIALEGLTLLAPVPRPGKIVAVGRNYADHAKETGVDPFEKPRIIAKLPSSVVGPNATVRRPPGVAKLDFEAELAVVIGAFASAVRRDRALEVVAGYTLLDDLSAREFQFDVAPPQTTFAKSMDGFCPMGPFLVTRDELLDPQHLELACFVNGVRMQHGRTEDMLFPVARLIEYATQFMTLEPGDVIATGTPAGIGAFRKPPIWLQPGDVVRVECPALGVLETKIA
jgi:2-keto-4-pentenoate hydratase/2-oxohepta-3-ene-1,7-dioic acid hydratase in catechol pathway